MAEEIKKHSGTEVLYLRLADENSKTIVPFKNIRSIHEVVDEKLIAKGYRSQIVFLGIDEGAFYVTDEINEIAKQINNLNGMEVIQFKPIKPNVVLS